jgi:hypothetical protein
MPRDASSERALAAHAARSVVLESTMFLESGLPEDRAARLAARRAFVEMKQLFQLAAEAVEDRKGAWLRAQVRQANDPIDLWLLRGPLLSAMRSGDDIEARRLRAELYRRLDSTFPETFQLDHTATRPLSPQPWQMPLPGTTAFMPIHP